MNIEESIPPQTIPVIRGGFYAEMSRSVKASHIIFGGIYFMTSNYNG